MARNEAASLSPVQCTQEATPCHRMHQVHILHGCGLCAESAFWIQPFIVTPSYSTISAYVSDRDAVFAPKSQTFFAGDLHR